MFKRLNQWFFVLLGLTQTCAAENIQRSLSTVRPDVPYNQALMPLIWWALGLSILVLVITGGALFYVVQKYRIRPNVTKEPEQFHGNNALEAVLVGVPLAMVALLSILTAHTLARVNQIPKTGTLKVDVTGYQFWWDFNYPELKIRTSNELIIPVGKTIEFSVTSKDVIHSFWVTSLGGKRDAIPGQKAGFTLTAQKPGIYYGQCLELCGSSHANMLFRVIALEPKDFETWKTQASSFAAAQLDASSPLQKGQQLFNANCSACHAIKGTQAAGISGPDLSYFGDRLTLGAGIFANTPEKVRQWIANASKLKPGSLMPAFDGSKDPKTGQLAVRLSDTDIASIAEYLESHTLGSNFRSKFGNQEF